jgi:chorismate-pyruvate lyase
VAVITGVPLTPFQRMLVGTDGTVTHILEAYAGEPIEVVKLRQVFDHATGADGPLDLQDLDEVLHRRVVLRTGHTRRNLLYAEAVVALARVAPEFVESLVGTETPIGVLLNEHRMETRREILTVGREPAGPTAVHFDLDPASELIVRSYRIVAGGCPIVVITEKFPTDLFRRGPA